MESSQQFSSIIASSSSARILDKSHCRTHTDTINALQRIHKRPFRFVVYAIRPRLRSHSCVYMKDEKNGKKSFPSTRRSLYRVYVAKLLCWSLVIHNREQKFLLFFPLKSVDDPPVIVGSHSKRISRFFSSCRNTSGQGLVKRCSLHTVSDDTTLSKVVALSRCRARQEKAAENIRIKLRGKIHRNKSERVLSRVPLYTC